MLIDSKGYKSQDVVTFKLSTGEEMIARYLEEDLTTFKVAKPITLVPTREGNFGMLPPVFSADVNTVNVQKSAIVLHSATRNDVAKEYIKATSSITPATSMPGALVGKGSS